MARIWITRAEPGASQTAARLSAMGHEPIIRPVLAVQALAGIAPPPADAAALSFSSLNGVAVFSVLLRDHPQIAAALKTRPVFAVGDATARAARDLGFARVASAGGDLKSLAALIAASWTLSGGPVLAVGAREPAGDLPALLQGHAEVRTFPVYEARPTGVAAPDGFEVVLVHSARAAAAVALGAGLTETRCRDRVAVAISEAAARPLAVLGFGRLRVAETPTEKALLLALGKGSPAV